MRPVYRIITVPEAELESTFMFDWYGDISGRYGAVNNFERGITLYKLVGWK